MTVFEWAMVTLMFAHLVVFVLFIRRSQKQVALIATDIHDLESSTNSKMDALLVTTKSSAHAAGREQGRAEGKRDRHPKSKRKEKP